MSHCLHSSLCPSLLPSLPRFCYFLPFVPFSYLIYFIPSLFLFPVISPSLPHSTCLFCLILSVPPSFLSLSCLYFPSSVCFPRFLSPSSTVTLGLSFSHVPFPLPPSITRILSLSLSHTLSLSLSVTLFISLSNPTPPFLLDFSTLASLFHLSVCLYLSSLSFLVGHQTEGWSVYRKYVEFYVLESKLTEFHGTCYLFIYSVFSPNSL